MLRHKEHTYLAGPIEGVSRDQALQWRITAAFNLNNSNIDTLDPTRRSSFVDSSDYLTHENAARRIWKSDLQDIAYSTVILANLSDSLPGKKWGTVCEIAHAHTKNKIIIILMDKDQFKHPFITQYATEIHHNLNDAVEAVKEYYI